MTARVTAWAPAFILLVGAFATVGPVQQRALPLRAELTEAVPMEIDRHAGTDVEITLAEQRAAGMSSYVMRAYSTPAADVAAAGVLTSGFSVYVGYYEEQLQGRTIHSPKNCLPGSGWEALTSQPHMIQTATGPVQVNRYLLQREDERALVLYWYQGRGRIEWNEYAVKWQLLRDAALRHRSDEALVRIVVPITSDETEALNLATRVAQELVPAVTRALPL